MAKVFTLMAPHSAIAFDGGFQEFLQSNAFPHALHLEVTHAPPAGTTIHLLTLVGFTLEL